MNKRVFAGASALSIALPGLIATMALMPAANAIESDDGAGNLSSGDSISSSATMEEQCKWVLIGAPSSVALTPTTPDAEYNGTVMELSASLSSISIHSTGNQDSSPTYDSFTECTFFESEFKPTATLAIDSIQFAASISGGDADSFMNFSTDGNPLAFSFTKASECSTWTAATTLDLETTSAGTLLDLSIGNVTTPVTSSGEKQNDKCQLTGGSVTINIPAGKNPTSPGSDYTFAGPTLTTALSTATS